MTQICVTGPQCVKEVKTLDLMVSNQKLWPPSHEVGQELICWNYNTFDQEELLKSSVNIRNCKDPVPT
jgi:hypothetical protein